MGDLEWLDQRLAQCKKACDDCGPLLNHSPTVECTRVFELLPLRYSAIGGNAAQRARLPQLPEHLRPFQDIGELNQSSYAIRPLREGFLYLLIKRKRQEAYQWHSQFRIAPNGSLLYIDADMPWALAPSPTTIDDMVRSFGWTITLHDLDDIQELRPLYSPDPLTPRMLDNYRLLDNEYRASLPAIDIGNFIQPSDNAPQPHVLKHDQLEWVADFKAQHDPALLSLLDTQPFNIGQIISMPASHQALSPAAGQIKPRGAAIVIDDAIGITQELNAWRNAAIEDIRNQWLQQPAEPGVDNERKLLVAQSFLEVEKLYPQMMAEQIVKREVMPEKVRTQMPRSMVAYEFSEQARKAADDYDAQMKPHLDQFERDTRAKVQTRQDAGEFKAKFDKKYGQLVNRQAMHDQLDSFEATLRHAQLAANARAEDHARWASSKRLLQALDRYDNTDLVDGLAFAEQTGRCIFSMELCSPGAKLLDQWWRSDLAARSNLAARGIAFNQDDIRDELTALREAAHVLQPAHSFLEMPESLARQALAAANAFARVNALYEHLQTQGATANVGLYAWYAALGRQVMRTAAPNSMDRALHHGLRLTLFASVHETAVNVRLTEAARSGQALDPNRSGGQITRYLDKAWAEGLMQANKSDFYKVRAAGLVCLLEGMLMAFKAGQLPDSDARLKTELLAAAMTTAAAGFEIGASYVEQVVTRYGGKSVTGKGTAVTLGRLKLWGVGLAGMGGLVLAGGVRNF
ncbi:T6SS effector BTH_I2691 family protein, partial [Pseudomonas fontis]